MTELQHPVLVVDNETDILDLMEMTLMKMGLRVHTASGVAEEPKTSSTANAIRSS